MGALFLPARLAGALNALVPFGAEVPVGIAGGGVILVDTALGGAAVIGAEVFIIAPALEALRAFSRRDIVSG